MTRSRNSREQGGEPWLWIRSSRIRPFIVTLSASMSQVFWIAQPSSSDAIASLPCQAFNANTDSWSSLLCSDTLTFYRAATTYLPTEGRDEMMLGNAISSAFRVINPPELTGKGACFHNKSGNDLLVIAETVSETNFSKIAR